MRRGDGRCDLRLAVLGHSPDRLRNGRVEPADLLRACVRGGGVAREIRGFSRVTR